MQSVQMGPWNPQPPSKDATPPLFESRGSRVTSATPAKRITFYRSGDSQFGGVRMAIHKRSFKCFDALLDDLSQKVPLPFGVRTVTTPRGTHTIKHLEQLQDGGCYLCSDRRQAKPINMELASKHQGTWYHHSQRPERPESSSVTPLGHLHLLHRQRRILLVRNSEPGVRRSIVLSRRSTRSLKAFLDEASEVMQFHVRKLYTVEGRRIDSVQSLMTCPAVLVCAGRETFSPVLLNFIRKTSEEKLPGLGSRSPGLGPRNPGNGARSPSTQGVRSPSHRAQSRASEDDEGQKNNNFGLETKKSIIHPRSDSSNRSTRFSMSSEKSYGVGSQVRQAIMNDDIEKRVLVNKDGSLSVEMKVRFRLQNDESIQWSTQIKKSPSQTNDCCLMSQTQTHYLHQSQSESCSDPDSTLYDGVDYSKCSLAENHCPCYYQRQNNQFDLWENLTNKHRPVPPTQRSNNTSMRQARSSSSSSSCNSRRMVWCRARRSGSPGGSEQSQFVQKEISVMEQVEHSIEVDQDGDTQVEVCKVSRCCSRTEVVPVDGDLLPPNIKVVEGELTMGQEENRPLSAISSSSRVLQSLKEDQDDDDDDEDDLPPSASQCSNRTERIPATHLDKEPTSNVSTSSVHSVKHKNQKENNETESRVSFVASTCHCGEATPHSATDANEPDRVLSSMSNFSKPRSEGERAADVVFKDTNRVASGVSSHTGRSASTSKSWMSDVCPNCGGWKHETKSPHPVLLLSNKENGNSCCDDVATANSEKIGPTISGSISAVTSTASDPNSKGKNESRVLSSTSALSLRSNMSHKSNCNGVSGVIAEKGKDRTLSAMSAQLNLSAMSKCTAEAGEERIASLLSDKFIPLVKFPKTNCHLSTKEAVLSDTVVSEEGHEEARAPSLLSVKSNASVKSGKAESLLSNKSTESNVSAKSETPDKSIHNQNAEAVSDEPAEGATVEERSTSVVSVKSNISRKSTKTSEKSRSPRSPSATSGRSSAKSSKSHRSNQTKTSLHQHDADISMFEMNGDKMGNRKDIECELSVKSGASHKSDSTGNLTSPNIAIIKIPESPDEDDTETKEQASNLLQDSNNKTADITVIETNSDSLGQTLSPIRQPSSRTHSPRAVSPKQSQSQQLLPKPDVGEQRLGRSRCCCGAASVLEKEKGEKGEDEEDTKYDGASERAASILSSSSKRQRKASGATEIPTSHNSSGSVSLGLQEDQEIDGSDSGKSGVSFLKSPEKSSGTKDPKRSGCIVSDSKKEITSAHLLADDIPTIKTPKGGDNVDERGGEQTIERAASASTVKSERSHKSCCNCSIKEADQMLDGNVEETKSVKSMPTTDASKMDTLSKISGNATIHRKSHLRAKVKNAMKDNANTHTDTENRDTKTNKKEGIAQNEAQSTCSQSSLRPESTSSAQQLKATHKSVKSCFSPVKSHKTKSKTESEGGSPCPLHNPRPSSKTKSGSESSVSAQRRETTPAACQHNKHSKSSKASDKPRSEKSERSQKRSNLNDQEDAVELTLECLPNKSPNEVVSDWLQSIPANSGMLTFDHELNEEDEMTKQMTETPGVEIGVTEASPNEEQEDNDDNAGQQEVDKDHKVDCDAKNPTLDDSARTSSHSKNWQYSAAVMKVLLSSSLGRCRSMPEVSPVYGRRLSTSASGLLDCLAQLQLIEPSVGCGSHQQKELKHQYDEVMAILQSLWLHEPRDIEAEETKDSRVLKQVTPQRSSSGVGMSSGSDGSGKGNGNQREDEMCTKEKEAVEKEDRNGNTRDKDTEMEHEETFKADTSRKSEDQSTVPQSRESPKTTENTSSSEKNSANNSFRYPTHNEKEAQEDVHSSAPQAPLSKRLSQDPDPIWVLQLLQKLEKQFMSHYIQAMAEFKVRWDLDDSLVLDAMISELRDEVSRRIQSSIQHEMKKIQSRAGKGGKWPRPPQLASISKDSTMTEKRRRIMKVMKNQSVKTADSVSDEDMTGSDQRSDDEYCPCDACVRKKMAARPLRINPLAAECPVMMEFDLRKILQLKKSPAPSTMATPQHADEEDEEARNLEMVEEEEEEETKVDTKTNVVLEETIPEDEEVQQEKNKREKKNSMEDEEQDKGEANERNETSENEEEEEEEEEQEEEEEGGCTCPSAKDEEESSREEEETSNCTDDKSGEETGEEEEESDKETVKEATAAKEEPTLVEETMEGNISIEAEDEDEDDDGMEDEESHDQETRSEEQDEEASEEDRASPQSQAEIPAGTEGEEADVEDSDDSKPDTSTEESGHEEAGGSGDEKENDGEENEEDVVEEFKHDEKSEEEEEAKNKNEDGTLLHQITRTSVESQPGSMEEADMDLTSNPVDSTKALKAADGVPARR